MMMSGEESTILCYTIITNLMTLVGAGTSIRVSMERGTTIIVQSNACKNLMTTRWVRRNAQLETTLALIWRKPPPQSDA